MTRSKLISLLLILTMLIGMIPINMWAEEDKTLRSVYLHAQGEKPEETVNTSIVYMGENADIYFAVNNPNMGLFENGIHKEPQYDMNGYTLRICYDSDYFEFAGRDIGEPIDYTIPDTKFGESGSVDENVGDDTIEDLPSTVGYYVYAHDSGTYKLGEKKYSTAFITVFFSGGYVPQKEKDTLWYNLAKLPLSPKKTGSTEVFIDIDSGEEGFVLELFAKNQSEELSEQTFNYNAVNGGRHSILIKDKSRPAPPVADPSSGSYIDKITVELTQEDDLPIYYTTNDDEPQGSTQRILYDGPIEISVDTKIKVCAYRESDDKYSNSVTYEYKILPDRPYLFDEDENLIPDRNIITSKCEVYVSDKMEFGNIEDGSEVYYTFANLDAEDPVIGDDPEESWVKVSKQNPIIEIDKNRTVKLITDKLGKYSEPCTYYFSIKPETPYASHESGEYDEKIDVMLESETEGAEIYYTTDGSDPKTVGIRYTDVPITIAKDTTLRAISYFDGEWSDKVSYYYLFKGYDDYGVGAFYPSGVYEGSVNVTLTPNNPEYKVQYHTGNGKWKDYTGVLVIEGDTEIIAKAVETDEEGNVISEGEEYVFTYKIKPLPPEFAPESTQFTNANKITVYTPESTAETTDRYRLYYTVDGTDPITSRTRIMANDESDSAIIEINKYTVVSAVVAKDDDESYSSVVTHSYDIVTVKPVKPITTLVSGYYMAEIGGEGYETQFMPVPQGTNIYYTVNYDGGLCPEPVPNTEGTYHYNGTDFIEIKGNTVIKAVAVNSFGVKSDVGIFNYTVSPEAPKAAPSATISGDKLPVIPVDAVKGSTVIYKIGGFSNSFVNEDDERFYINGENGMAYRDEECTERLGKLNTGINGKNVTLEILSELDGVESDINRYNYSVTGNAVLAPPYADKETGIYEEIRIDDDNNILKVMLYSLNPEGEIQYRTDNAGDWETYDGEGLLFKEYTILQLRCAKDDMYSAVVSYVYDFMPLPPVIELPSGTYLASDDIYTKISYDEKIPADKDYNIFYRQNGDTEDVRYNGSEISPENLNIDHTMTIKAYVLNEETRKVSKNTIHYYIIESGTAASGNVYIAYPYDTERISAHLLTTGDYAEGIKLLSQNKTADIRYYYTYTKVSDGKEIKVNEAIYDVTRPIIPTANMDDIKIYARLTDEDGEIEGSKEVFVIDFVHLDIPETSLEESGKVEFPKGTKYTLINDYPGDENILIYYTLDGSDPADSDNSERIIYSGEELSLSGATTVKTVYYSACGKCVNCKEGDIENCWYGVYGETGIYKYTIPKSSGGGGGGGVIDKTRKYTIDIFGNEHPTHIGYINGYPDGSVQPEGDITREEITAILYRITNHEYEKPFAETGEVFPDVNLGRWSTHDIEYMADREIVYGYPDGEFKPGRNLTRAEFAALIFRFTGIGKAKIKNPFTDLEETHWAYNEILALANSGLIEGYPDKTYKPEDNITRAEVMTVINKLLGRKPVENYVKSLGFNPYNDLYSEEWYYVTVLEATITHNYWLDSKGWEYEWENWK